MKSKLNSFLLFTKKHKTASIITAVVVLLLVISGVVIGNKPETQTYKVALKEFNKETAVAGKVIAAKDASLSFETSGKIAAVYKDVNQRVTAGETIAVLSSGDVQADLLKAQADLDAAIAQLNEVKSGSGADTETLNAKRTLVEELAKAYIQADDAIHNKVDQFYEDPFSKKPEIAFAFNDYQLKEQLNKDRVEMETLLKAWEADRNSITIDKLSTDKIEQIKNRLRKVQAYLDTVAKAVNMFEAGSADLTQAQVDKYKADVASARTNINESITAIISAQEKIRGVEAQIPFLEAKVKAARATVSNYNAQLGKARIVAPFSGIIAKQDAKVGEFASSNVPLVTVISSGSFQIETFVPEINIKEIKIGNVAKVTLDAFDETEVFDAKVISIDPAETLRDGVSTYKVVFEFVNTDDRFKTGMTANVDITTEKRTDAITIPQDVIIKRDGFTYVQVKIGKETIEKQITTGDVSSTGEIEVISGLNVGEKIVLDPQPLN